MMNPLYFILLLILLILVLALGITMIALRNKYTNPTALLIAGILLTVLGFIGLIILLYYALKPVKITRKGIIMTEPVTEIIPRPITPQIVEIDIVESRLQPERIVPIQL